MKYPKSIWLAGFVAFLIALALNMAMYYLGHALGYMRLDLPVQPPQQQINEVAVIFVTVLSSVVATLVYWVMRRFFRLGFRWFLVVSAVVFIYEFFMPFLLPAPLSMIVWLQLMHFTMAAPILFFFWKLPPVKRR